MAERPGPVQRKTSNQLPKAYAPNQGDDGENDETLRPGLNYFTKGKKTYS